MTNETVISVARDYSKTPGLRFRWQSDYSGEEFRETVLVPAFRKALESGTRLRVDLSGIEGYATSFLEEAFGGLARDFGVDVTQGSLDVVCTEEPELVAEVQGYIRDAESRRRK